MIATTTHSASDASSHSYQGLEQPDANPATRIEYQKVSDSADFSSESDWRKTHKPTWFEYLDQLNRGVTNGVRRNKPYYTYQANQHLCQALSGSLELTTEERAEAETWFRVIDFQKMGHSVEKVGLCICARVVHETTIDQRKCHPSNDDEIWPSVFLEKLQSWGANYESQFHKIYAKVDDCIRKFEDPDFDSEPASERMNQYGVGTPRK